MNWKQSAIQAGFEEGWIDVCAVQKELERLFALARTEALEEAIKIIEEHRIPVGNSAAGEIACELTYAALHEIRDEIRALKDKK